MTKLFSVRIPAEVLTVLTRYAEIEHRTLSSMIVHILRDWIARKNVRDMMKD